MIEVQNVIGNRPLSVDEARAIVAIAYLAADVDLDEDSEERQLLESLTDHVARLSGLPPELLVPRSPIPTDHEERLARIRQVAQRLDSPKARELAYAIAYILVIADLALEPIETRFLEELQRVLGIEDDRAADIAASAAEAVT